MARLKFIFLVLYLWSICSDAYLHSLRRRRNADGLICGTGAGACCAGSSGDCPEEAPICSEWGYCQCASYQPGGPECGPGFDENAAQESNQQNDGEQVCGEGEGACCAGSNDGCPPEAPVCSEYGYCQCATYKPGDPECGPGFGDSASSNMGREAQSNGDQICGEGQGACCAGSDDGCPPEAPVCSEYGYCQCASYKPGDPECGPGFGDNQVVSEQGNAEKICGTGPGACCAGSNDGCPPEAPVCSEWGYCQCETYQPGGPECGPGFDDMSAQTQNKESINNACGDPECNPGFDDADNNEVLDQDNEMLDYDLTPRAGGADNNMDSLDSDGMTMPGSNNNQICGQGQGACCAGSNDGCPPEAPVCSEYGYCQCASYKPGDPECGPGFDDLPTMSQATENDDNSAPGVNKIADGNVANEKMPRMDNNSPTNKKGKNDADQICGEGPGFGDSASSNMGREAQSNGDQICGQGEGACCAGSNDGCPPEAPVCSEYGYCQCASYKPGDPECGPGFGDSASNNKVMETQVCGQGQGACCVGSNDGCSPEAPVCSEWGYCQCAEYQPGGPECGPGFSVEARQGRSNRKRPGRKGNLGRTSQLNRGKSGSQVRAARRGKSKKQRKPNRRGKSSRSKQGKPGKSSRRKGNTKFRQG